MHMSTALALWIITAMWLSQESLWSINYDPQIFCIMDTVNIMVIKFILSGYICKGEWMFVIIKCSHLSKLNVTAMPVNAYFQLIEHQGPFAIIRDHD